MGRGRAIVGTSPTAAHLSTRRLRTNTFATRRESDPSREGRRFRQLLLLAQGIRSQVFMNDESDGLSFMIRDPDPSKGEEIRSQRIRTRAFVGEEKTAAPLRCNAVDTRREPSDRALP